MSNSQPRSMQPQTVGQAKAEVLTQAKLAIAEHGQLRHRLGDLEFELEGKTLIVRGHVPTYYVKQLLQSVLKGLDGVGRIENEVEVIAAKL
jgi:hypothetical protein